jgi:DNA repair protein RadC
MNSLSTIRKLHAVREVNSEEAEVYNINPARPSLEGIDTEAREDYAIRRALDVLRRRLRELGAAITSPQLFEAFLQLRLGEREQEVFCALFLDTRHRVIEFREMFYGTIDGASVHPREVVKVALQVNAAAVIFSHNHPSGVADPSHADIQITKRLKDSLALIDVRVLDHIVVTADETVSLAQRGEL